MPPIVKKPTVNRWIANETLLKALESNTRIIQRAMMNNTFLLKKTNISLDEQIRQIAKRTDGFKLHKTRMSNLKAGRDKKIDITIISILAEYHSLPLETMIMQELWLQL
jgi:hypothetical protein